MERRRAVRENLGDAPPQQHYLPAVDPFRQRREPGARDGVREKVALAGLALELLDQVDAVEPRKELLDGQPRKRGEPPPGTPGQRLGRIRQARWRLPDDQRFHLFAVAK
jgi:hypothetical protein